MKWENITSPEFEKAVKICKKLCVLPLGVLEKHGDHLPLGTDMMIINSIAELASSYEPVVIFPPYYFTQILEARHWPGAIAIGRDLLMKLLENVCDEISRNGFTKIYLLNGHGGNNSFVPFFLQTMLEKKKPYALYFSSYGIDIKYEEIKNIIETEYNLHGGEIETSLMMALFPDPVKVDEIPIVPAHPLGRLKLPPGVITSIQWYADYPNHYAGDARKASVEKGERILDLCVEYVVSNIKAIKGDNRTPELLKKFYHSVF